MKEVWMLKNKKADFEHICQKFGVSMPMSRLIVNRGYTTDEEIEKYINPSLSHLHSPYLLKDMKKAVEIIKKAIDNGEHIRIVGDYDVDGVTATYLLLHAFEELGAYVSYRIPDRVADGYGINRSIIEDAVKDGIDMIVTCDNGISAKTQIEYAKQMGMTVVVTDHHDIPDELPPADCIINPKQENCEYPDNGICGAVVAAKLCEALYEAYDFGNFIESNLDIMALATICDVMDLTGENRAIVKLGLEEINKKNNVGIKALIEECGLMDKRISTYHIGFVIGPCLNATGRLETADAGVEILRTRDIKEAKYLAGHLKELNEIRKEKTLKNTDRAAELIDNSKMLSDSVLVVYLKGCHESIAGIIAGRVREKYNRPAIVFTDSIADDEVLKGSGRSVETYNMYEGIKECSDLLLKFGGHPMAAGLSIAKDSLEDFRKKINENCKEDLTVIPKKQLIDIRMPLSVSDCDFVEELRMLEPTGKGNEKPVFADREITVKRISRFGREGNFLKLDLIDSSGFPVNAKMFNCTEKFLDEFERTYGEDELNQAFLGKGSGKVHFIYSPEVNEYNGIRSVQINISSYMFPLDVSGVAETSVKNTVLTKSTNTDGNTGSSSSSNSANIPDSNEDRKDRCLIFCAGDRIELPFAIKPTDYIIAADAGYNYVKSIGLTPHEVIGDFDSLENSESIKQNIRKSSDSSGTIITEYPVEKDETDAEIAVKCAIKNGYKNIFLLGVTGGKRIDHTIANISLLAYAAKQGVKAYMFDGTSCLTVIQNTEITFESSCKGTLSVFAFGGKAEGVTLKNLKYELTDAELLPEVSLGVSNSFVGKEAKVSVKKGKLLIVGEYLPDSIASMK